MLCNCRPVHLITSLFLPLSVYLHRHWVTNVIKYTFLPHSLVPRPLPDFISQPWSKTVAKKKAGSDLGDRATVSDENTGQWEGPGTSLVPVCTHYLQGTTHSGSDHYLIVLIKLGTRQHQILLWRQSHLHMIDTLYGDVL